MKDSLVQNDMIAFTVTGTVLTTVSGSMSFTSSCLIMITVLRSKQNTPYHRIMFFMSFWDAVASLLMALTTIPLPSDVVYDYATPSYGTTRTCRAQASIILFSLGLVLMSNIILNIYYLCAIRYNVPDATFRLRAEPIFLLTAIPISLFQPVYYALNGIFNPTPYFTFCMIDPFYPNECIVSADKENCINAELDKSTSTAWKVYEYVNTTLASLQFLVLCVTMFLIVQTAKRQKEAAELSRHQFYSNTKSIAWQASMYICACILTWIFPILHFHLQENRILNALSLFFFPMQGFFHLLIFLFHKVHSYKKRNQSSSWEALKVSLRKPWEIDDNQELVDNLEIIDFDASVRRISSKIQKQPNIDFAGMTFFSRPNGAISATKNENDPCPESKDLSVQPANSLLCKSESVGENRLKSVFGDFDEFSVANRRSVFSSPY